MGIQIHDQHNKVFFCNVPFSAMTSNDAHSTSVPLNTCKEQGSIESYSVTQTTLEQIFVQLAGEDEDIRSQSSKNSNQQSKSYLFHSVEVENILFIWVSSRY